MARPHPALIDIAAGRAVGPVDDEAAFVESALKHRLAGLALWAANNDMLSVGISVRLSSPGSSWPPLPTAPKWLRPRSSP
jgi:hypothetical protein